MTNEEFDFALEHWHRKPDPIIAKQMTKHAFRALVSSGGEIARFFPAWGIFEAFMEDRPVYAGRGPKQWLRSLLLRYLRHQAGKLGDRAGVNDYLMVKWIITRDARYAERLRERSQRDDMIGWSCRWMLSSQLPKNPDLAAQFGEPEFAPTSLRPQAVQ